HLTDDLVYHHPLNSTHFIVDCAVNRCSLHLVTSNQRYGFTTIAHRRSHSFPPLVRASLPTWGDMRTQRENADCVPATLGSHSLSKPVNEPAEMTVRRRLVECISFTLATDDIEPRFRFRCSSRLLLKCALSLVAWGIRTGDAI